VALNPNFGQNPHLKKSLTDLTINNAPSGLFNHGQSLVGSSQENSHRKNLLSNRNLQTVPAP